MNTHLVCIKGKSPEIKESINVPFCPTFAKIKLVGYKVPQTVVEVKDEKGDVTGQEIIIPQVDVESGLLFIHCSLWCDSPIGVVASPSEIVCPDTNFPLFGTKVSGNVTFTLRDVNDQLSDVEGDFTIMIEFHK